MYLYEATIKLFLLQKFIPLLEEACDDKLTFRKCFETMKSSFRELKFPSEGYFAKFAEFKGIFNNEMDFLRKINISAILAKFIEENASNMEICMYFVLSATRYFFTCWAGSQFSEEVLRVRLQIFIPYFLQNIYETDDIIEERRCVLRRDSSDSNVVTVPATKNSAPMNYLPDLPRHYICLNFLFAFFYKKYTASNYDKHAIISDCFIKLITVMTNELNDKKDVEIIIFYTENYMIDMSKLIR
ncbi:MAG: hypothetical protein ACRDDF_04880, partial [Aeromonas sp.]